MTEGHAFCSDVNEDIESGMKCITGKLAVVPVVWFIKILQRKSNSAHGKNGVPAPTERV